MPRSPSATKRRLALLAVSVVTTLLVSACGASDGSSSSGPKVKVDVGDGKTITVQGPIRLAYFAAGSNNAYLNQVKSSVEKEIAKVKGASVTTFDPGFDAQKQLQQIQNAITSSKYNAFFINAVDGDLVCKPLTELAPKRNIAVVNVAAPLCGRALKPSAAEHYAPGTVAIIDNLSTDFLVDWYNYMADRNPGPQKILLIDGPEPHTTTPIHAAALEKVTAEHPDFQVEATGHTDWSKLQGLKVTQSMLKAHPDATILMGIYSDITEGALTAIKQAGMEGKIKVYDRGGASGIIDDIKAGKVMGTTANYPVDSAVTAVDLLQKAFAGKKFDHVILNEGGPVPAGSKTGMTPIDASNVKDFQPQY
jgi:ribose transport system substrate-binding protein